MANPITKNENASNRGNGHSENRITEILMPDNPEGTESSSIATELGILRSDYINRIAGMVKAIAAVERSRDKSFESLGYVEKLPNMNASELVSEYRRISASFRSAFPSSFGLAASVTGRGSRMKNPEVYK